MKLFTLTKKDFVVETFRSGGKGGQHQNKTDSGVRIKHPASGAAGESREERSQLQNKRNAFKRMTSSKKFRAWHRIKCAELISKQSIAEIVESLMQPHNLKIEVKDSKGRWIDEQDTLQ